MSFKGLEFETVVCDGKTPRAGHTGHPIFLALAKDIVDLHLRKSADYGSDEDIFANYRSSEDVGIPGHMSAWLRAKEKIKRIDLALKRGTVLNESVEDSLMDVAVISLIVLAMLREQNVP